VFNSLSRKWPPSESPLCSARFRGKSTSTTAAVPETYESDYQNKIGRYWLTVTVYLYTHLDSWQTRRLLNCAYCKKKPCRLQRSVQILFKEGKNSAKIVVL
jgi:hypothetical protein